MDAGCTRPWVDFDPIRSFTAAYLLHEEAFTFLKCWKISGGPLLDREVLKFDQALVMSLRSLGVDSVVPIPQKRRRYWEIQRYPSLVIAQSVARLLDVPVVHALEDLTEGKAQAKSSAEERLKKSFGALIPVYGSVLVVDDFLTTGQTLLQASKVLCSVGAGKVHVFTLGRKSHPASKLSDRPLHQ